MSANTSAPNEGHEGAGSSNEPAKYRLTEPAYINDVFYDQARIDAGTAVIFHDGIPAHFMFPLNAAAKAAVKKHQPKKIDPLAALTIVAPSAPAPAAQQGANTPLAA